MAVIDNRVVVGLGGRTRNVAAVELAGRLAMATGRPLVVVTAWTDGTQLARVRRASDDAAGSRLPQIQRMLRRTVNELCLGVDVETRAVCGPPGPTLVQLAGLPGDLLVIGAGHRFGSVSSGDVAQYCLSHARCPVLTVPASPATSPAVAAPVALADQGSNR